MAYPVAELRGGRRGPWPPPTKKKKNSTTPCQLSAHRPYQHSASQNRRGQAQLAFCQLLPSAQQRTHAHRWSGNVSFQSHDAPMLLKPHPPPGLPLPANCWNLALLLRHRRRASRWPWRRGCNGGQHHGRPSCF